MASLPELRRISGARVGVAIAGGDSIGHVKQKVATHDGVPVPFIELVADKTVLGDTVKVKNILAEKLTVNVRNGIPFEISKVAPGQPQEAISYRGEGPVIAFPPGPPVVVRFMDDTGHDFETAAIFSVLGPGHPNFGCWCFHFDKKHSMFGHRILSDAFHNPEPGIVECAESCETLNVTWYTSMEAARAAVPECVAGRGEETLKEANAWFNIGGGSFTIDEGKVETKATKRDAEAKTTEIAKKVPTAKEMKVLKRACCSRRNKPNRNDSQEGGARAKATKVQTKRPAAK